MWSRRSHVAWAKALSVGLGCWLALAAPSPLRADDLADLARDVRKLQAEFNLDIPAIAGLMVNAKVSETDPPILSRWRKDQVRIGLSLSRNIPADQIDIVLQSVRAGFFNVLIVPELCLIEDPKIAPPSQKPALATCASEDLDIVLVLSVHDGDIDEIAVIAGKTGYRRSPQMQHFWDNTIQEFGRQNYGSFCSMFVAISPQSFEIERAEALLFIRPDFRDGPTQWENCAKSMGHYSLLGSRPYQPEGNGRQSISTAALKSILYNKALSIGMTEAEIAAVLEKAVAATP